MVLDSQGRERASREATPNKRDGVRAAHADRGRPVSSELDARHLQAIALFITNPNKAAVAVEIGVSSKTLTRWFQIPAFVDEYRRQLAEVQLELWAKMVAAKNEAWGRFQTLMADPDPRISLRATTWFLERLLSAPSFLGKPVARESGIGAGLERRERELLELVGALERGDADRSGLGDSDKGDEGSDDGPDIDDGDDAGEVKL